MDSTTITTDNVEELANEIQEIEPIAGRVTKNHIIAEFVERVDKTDSGIVLAGVQKTRDPELVVIGFSERARDEFLSDEGVELEIGMVVTCFKHDVLTVKMGDGREVQVLTPKSIWLIPPAE